MCFKVLVRAINATLTVLVGGASSVYAQQQADEKSLVVTLGIPMAGSNEDSIATAKLQKIFDDSGNKNYAIDFDPSGLVAKVIIKDDDKNKSLDSLIKKLNSQMKNKVVIIEVEPAKITNGTQDDL